MTEKDNRNELIREALERIAAKSNPTVVQITERIKRKYWI